MWVADKSYSDMMRELWGSPAVWNEKRTYVEIARKLGVDEETVRNRVRHLKESGFLQGWRLLPNPALFGRKSYFVFLDFQNAESKEDAIPHIETLDGVANIASIYDASLLVTLFDDAKMEAARRVSEMGDRAKSFTSLGMNVPGPFKFQLKRTDWLIIRSMLRDAERKTSDIAREVKISTKSVSRRLEALLSSRAVFIMPLVNLKKAGGISYQLLVEAKEGKESEVVEFVSSRIENLVFKATASRSDLIFGFNGTNVAEGNEILRWIRKLPEVKSARLNIIEQVVHAYDWVEREVEKRIRT